MNNLANKYLFKYQNNKRRVRTQNSHSKPEYSILHRQYTLNVMIIVKRFVIFTLVLKYSQGRNIIEKPS